MAHRREPISCKRSNRSVRVSMSGQSAFIWNRGRGKTYWNLTPSSRDRLYRWQHADYQDWFDTQRDIISWARGAS